MTRKVAAEQRGDHGDTKKNEATESTRTEYSAAPHDHNVMNWGVILAQFDKALGTSKQLIRTRFDKALGTSRQLLTLVSTLTTDAWSSDKFRRTVDTSCVCIAAWMISILTTLSCMVVAFCIVVVAIYIAIKIHIMDPDRIIKRDSH